jgi:hypothetical protein
MKVRISLFLLLACEPEGTKECRDVLLNISGCHSEDRTVTCPHVDHRLEIGDGIGTCRCARVDTDTDDAEKKETDT